MRAQIPRPAGARPGGPAPWAHLPSARRRGITLDEVRRALSERATRPRALGGPRDVMDAELPAGGDARPAAVLCLLFEEANEANVVLTRRSPHLRAHGGEVSFPGGRLQPGELPLQAALREAREEIGVDVAGIQVIGELTPLTTQRSPALVHCFVGTFPGPGPGGRAFTPDASEVDKVFWAPLALLVADGVFHEELWPAPGRGTPGPGPGGDEGQRHRAVPFFSLGDDTVWGATGRLLTELLSAVLVRPDAGGLPDGSLVVP